MGFNGIGDVIFKRDKEGRERVDYDALIGIIERNGPGSTGHIEREKICDGYLPAGRYDYSTYRDIWEAIVRERGVDDAWKIVYGLWRIQSGTMPIGVLNCTF